MLARAFALIQYVLPRYWITSLIYRLARVRHKGVKDFLITRFVRMYKVDTGDVKLEIPAGFQTFNDFFIRELEDGARPVDDDPRTLVSPVDGTVSQAGSLRGNLVLQAKGHEYTVDDLLATDLAEARAYKDGTFATIYLAPYNYHRIHAPFAGEVVAARYVPGDLFSVNNATAASVPGLFRRNERLVLHFRTDYGPAALVFVGALNVGSISTPWSGEVRPRKSGVVEAIDLNKGLGRVDKGDLLGWFNMGSTVILLLPGGVCEWHENIVPGEAVCMGRPIAQVVGSAS
jgi:phosphatidylserine decarboxylase